MTDISLVKNLGYPGYDDFWYYFNLDEDGLKIANTIGVYWFLYTDRITCSSRFGEPLSTKWEYISE